MLFLHRSTHRVNHTNLPTHLSWPYVNCQFKQKFLYLGSHSFTQILKPTLFASTHLASIQGPSAYLSIFFYKSCLHFLTNWCWTECAACHINVGQRWGSDQSHSRAQGGTWVQHPRCFLRVWHAQHRHGQEGAICHAVWGKPSSQLRDLIHARGHRKSGRKYSVLILGGDFMWFSLVFLYMLIFYARWCLSISSTLILSTFSSGCVRSRPGAFQPPQVNSGISLTSLILTQIV